MPMPMAKSEEAPTGSSCPVCEGLVVRPFADLGNRRFSRCRSCRTVFQDPLQTAANSKAIHNDRYQGATVGYFQKTEKKLRRARGQMRWLRLLAPGGRLLDIGSNGGFLVEAAREFGLDASGIDIDPVSVAYAQRHFPQCTFYEGTVEELAPRVEQFDLVFCSEVIEHIPAARDFIFSVARVLKPGGFLYITTPDINHWMRPHDATKWKSMRDPGHCVFYSRSGLKSILRTVGIDWWLSFPDHKTGMQMLFRKLR